MADLAECAQYAANDMEEETMKRLFTSNLKAWHLIVLIPVVALGRGRLATAQAPLRSDVQIETASSVTPIEFTVGGPDAVDLNTAFTVASRRQADIAIFYNGTMETFASGGCRVEFHIDSPSGAILDPGAIALNDSFPIEAPFSANGFTMSVGPGTHAVYARVTPIDSPYVGDVACALYKRSLIVVVASHP